MLLSTKCALYGSRRESVTVVLVVLQPNLPAKTRKFNWPFVSQTTTNGNKWKCAQLQIISIIVGIGSDEQHTKEPSASSMDGLVWILLRITICVQSHHCKHRLQVKPELRYTMDEGHRWSVKGADAHAINIRQVKRFFRLFTFIVWPLIYLLKRSLFKVLIRILHRVSAVINVEFYSGYIRFKGPIRSPKSISKNVICLYVIVFVDIPVIWTIIDG